jgi:tryptophan synthase
MEAGGAEIIELGVPFTDPIADGPTIQRANTVALRNGVTTSMCLQMVRDARKAGLKAPVLLMGYYNPVLSYGEERLIKDAREAGVNGFIMVDLPPEEAIRFRNFCKEGGYVMEILSSGNLRLTYLGFPMYHLLHLPHRKDA